jgi:hypothetical protein
MRPTPRLLTTALCVASLLSLGLTLVEVGTSAAAGTLPTTVNEVVSTTGSLTGPNCPSFTGVSPAPTPYSNLQTAVTAATTREKPFTCALVSTISHLGMAQIKRS